MRYVLDDVAVRSLGVLVEKQMTTPDYYPLTLNALINACNQRTNREPVMDLAEEGVLAGLAKLRDQRLVWQVKTQNSRTLKYEHNLKEVLQLEDRELALLGVLMLRGPQTAGELRSRTQRMAAYPSVTAVEHALQKLASHENGPFAMQLSREPGQKESRYMHLMSGPGAAPPPRPVLASQPEPAGAAAMDAERIGDLESRVQDLESEVATLREMIEEWMTRAD